MSGKRSNSEKTPLSSKWPVCISTAPALSVFLSVSVYELSPSLSSTQCCSSSSICIGMWKERLMLSPHSQNTFWKSVSLLLLSVSCLATTFHSRRALFDTHTTMYRHTCACVCARACVLHTAHSFILFHSYTHTQTRSCIHSCALRLPHLNIRGANLSSPVLPEAELQASAICRLSLSITFQSSFSLKHTSQRLAATTLWRFWNQLESSDCSATAAQ